MRNFLIAALAALAAVPAVAGTTPTSFAHEGYSFTYTTETDAAGRTVINGKRSDGVRFRYVVADGRVTGVNDRTPVSFALTDVKPRSVVQSD